MVGIASRVKAFVLLSLLFSGAAAEQQPREIRPGAAELDGARVQPGVWEIRYVRVADGKEQEVGISRQQIDVIERDGETLLRSVLSLKGPLGVAVDTAIAVRSTLHPRIHRGHHPARTLTLDFGAGWVRGKTVAEGKAPVEKRDELDAPLFDANVFEVVLGSLPLRDGLHVRVPTYVFEREGPLWFDARVSGLEDIDVNGAAAPAWAVQVKTDQGEGTFYIHRDSRQFVGGVFRSKDGSELRMVRAAITSSGGG